jgi:predicted DNA binding CopG/RHH family protein
MNKSKESVTLRLLLPKDMLVSVWKVAAQRKITIERYLEELLEREELRQTEAEENKEKNVKFPI